MSVIKDTNKDKTWDAIIVDTKDPEKRGRVKLRVEGQHPGDLPEDQLPWALVQPLLGSNSGKGIKNTISVGQFCKVKSIDTAMTEFMVVSGANAFRSKKGGGTPYSVIKNKELFDVPIPDLASLDPMKLGRTIFADLQAKLIDKITAEIPAFAGTIGTCMGGGGCGGGAAGGGGPGVPPATTPPVQTKPKIKIIVPKSGATQKVNVIDTRSFENLAGVQPVNIPLGQFIQIEEEQLSGQKAKRAATFYDVKVTPVYNTAGSVISGVKEKNKAILVGTDAYNRPTQVTIDKMMLQIPKNIFYKGKFSEYYIEVDIVAISDSTIKAKAALIFTVGRPDNVKPYHYKVTRRANFSPGLEKEIDNEIEEIDCKSDSKCTGGYGLGACPGTKFKEIPRTDDKGKAEEKYVQQWENGISMVVDTSTGNKSWSLGTNDGARIEIGAQGTTLLKGAKDVQIATDSGTITVSGSECITIVDGIATIHCDSFSVKAKTIDLVAPVIALNGDVEISGKLGVAKTLEVKQDIASDTNIKAKSEVTARYKGKGINLSTHIHDKVQVGTGVTGAPK